RCSGGAGRQGASTKRASGCPSGRAGARSSSTGSCASTGRSRAAMASLRRMRSLTEARCQEDVEPSDPSCMELNAKLHFNLVAVEHEETVHALLELTAPA